MVACAQCGACQETGLGSAWIAARLGECPLPLVPRALAAIGGSQRGWPVRDAR